MSNPTLKALVTVSLEVSNPSFLSVLSEGVLSDIQDVITEDVMKFLDRAEEEDISVADAISDASNFCLYGLNFAIQPFHTEIEGSVLKVAVLMLCKCNFDLEVDGETVDISAVNLEGAQTAWENHVRETLTLTEFSEGERCAEDSLKASAQDTLGLVVSRLEVDVRGPQVPEPTAPTP